MAITSADYQVQVEIEHPSNIAKNRVINTYAFKSLGGVADLTALATMVSERYQVLAPKVLGGSSLATGEDAHTIKIYNLGDPKPRPPREIFTFGMTGASGISLPAEVALCASFSAAAPAGVVAARRRGRVFIGPLSSNTLGSMVDGYQRPTADAIEDVNDLPNSIALQAGAAGFDLCVWSRKDQTLFPVVRGWTNNEFDTQRRRQPEPTSRTPWLIPIAP